MDSRSFENSSKGEITTDMNARFLLEIDDDILMDGGVEESKSVPPTSETPDTKVIDYKAMRAEARRRRYPDYFKGRSDPSEEPAEARTEGPFIPQRIAAKPEVDTRKARLTLAMDPDTKKIQDVLAADNGKAFAGFLKNPTMARKAIQRLLRMKLPSFHQVRLLAMWHLLRQSHAANVNVAPKDRAAVADYLAEVHQVLDSSFVETRKRLMVTLDEPSWLWLDFFKRLWTPEMGPELKARVGSLGPHAVQRVITPLIQAYHLENKPYRHFAGSSRSAFPGASRGGHAEVEIPSLWYRSLFYPLLGGEPRGLFDDTPMSFKETLSTMMS